MAKSDLATLADKEIRLTADRMAAFFENQFMELQSVSKSADEVVIGHRGYLMTFQKDGTVLTGGKEEGVGR